MRPKIKYFQKIIIFKKKKQKRKETENEREKGTDRRENSRRRWGKSIVATRKWKRQLWMEGSLGMKERVMFDFWN